MEKQYHKLVRDKIPEIIAATGQKCDTQVLDADAYLALLDEKLQEELKEYLADGSIEELADLLEVLYAAAQARGYTPEQLEAVRREKAEKRGAFHDRILLTRVYD